MRNFHGHDEQTVNGLRKIAWASAFRLKFYGSMSISPCHVSMSMSPRHVSTPCLHVSIFPYFPISCLCLHVSVSPCLHVSGILQKETQQTENSNFLLFAANENGNGKFPFVCCKRKWKIEFCFPWSASLLQT